MSQEYGNVTQYQYEYYDELKPIVIPHSLADLKLALTAKAEIQEMIDRHMPDGAHDFFELMSMQEGFIKTYIDSLGAFENGILINNISFLIKKHGIRLGDLESLLGISTGYISRTAKENSGKRMSIDIAWKIARLFNIDFGRFISVDLSESKGNTAMLLRFIEKMIRQTEEGKLQWEIMGGDETELDPVLVECGLVTEDGEKLIYNSDHLNPKMTFYLAGDVMCTKQFNDDGNDLLMIPFHRDGAETIHFDFLFAWDGNVQRGESNLEWQKAFYTFDDPFGQLDQAAAQLFETAKDYELDAKLDPDVRSFIDRYIEEE